MTPLFIRAFSRRPRQETQRVDHPPEPLLSSEQAPSSGSARV
jgi:hypothetical protein